jgi:hypothetical protein
MGMGNMRALVGLGLGTPLLVLTLLGMMLIPLPPLALDLLFTFNIALSLVVLLVSVYALRPLDFAVFPTLLLVATLLRLALNVASTRLVLLNGHTGPGAAGDVIEAFGSFVIGGNYAVGLVVFVILMVRGQCPFHPGRHAGQADGHRRRPFGRRHHPAAGPGTARGSAPGIRLLRRHGRCQQVRAR